ncbi:MAG TPA: MlaD family protein [Terriglobia bacterium]|nr:MlaD family protein [Terriglobia bacterium]
MAELHQAGGLSLSRFRRIITILLALGVGFVAGVVGSRYSWEFFTPSYVLKADLAVPGSLHVKDPVQVAGVQVGRVWDIGLVPTGDKPVEVSMRIAKRFQPVIRADSEASVGTTGLLGSSFVDITRGSVNQPVLQAGATIKTADRTATLTCDEIMKTFSRIGDALKSPFNH